MRPLCIVQKDATVHLGVNSYFTTAYANFQEAFKILAAAYK